MNKLQDIVTCFLFGMIFSLFGCTFMLVSIVAMFGGPKFFRWVNNGLNNNRFWWWMSCQMNDRFDGVFGRARAR